MTHDPRRGHDSTTAPLHLSWDDARLQLTPTPLSDALQNARWHRIWVETKHPGDLAMEKKALRWCLHTEQDANENLIRRIMSGELIADGHPERFDRPRQPIPLAFLNVMKNPDPAQSSLLTDGTAVFLDVRVRLAAESEGSTEEGPLRAKATRSTKKLPPVPGSARKAWAEDYYPKFSDKAKRPNADEQMKAFQEAFPNHQRPSRRVMQDLRPDEWKKAGRPPKQKN